MNSLYKRAIKILIYFAFLSDANYRAIEMNKYLLKRAHERRKFWRISDKGELKIKAFHLRGS